MPLQIRNADGTVTPAPEGTFVEITGDDGAVGMVFFQVPGMVMQVVPGTVDADRYEQMFKHLGVKFNKLLLQRR